MLRFGILLALTLTLLHPVYAQDTPQPTTWYWAWRESTGELFAYNAAGEVNPLMENIYPFGLERIDDETAVVMIGEETEYSAYFVTPETAHNIGFVYTGSVYEGRESVGMMGFPGVSVLTLAYPYLFIWNHDYDKQLLYNRETGIAEQLDFDEWWEIRASEDGRKLRFISGAIMGKGLCWVGLFTSLILKPLN